MFFYFCDICRYGYYHFSQYKNIVKTDTRQIDNFDYIIDFIDYDAEGEMPLLLVMIFLEK